MTRSRALIATALFCLTAAIPTQPVHAAAPLTRPLLDLPGDRRPELPIPEDPIPKPQELILPPIPPPLPFPGEARAVEVWVGEVRIRGNTVISDAELAAIAAPYEGRSLDGEALEALRLALTHAYVDRGYVNSGAILPDQGFDDRVLDVEIVEGRLSEIRIRGVGTLRQKYLAARFELGAEERLNVHEIERRLQLLQAESQILTVNAELRPGLKTGQAILEIVIEDAQRYHLSVSAANDRSPAIGADNAQIDLGFDNIIGHGDFLASRATLSSGLADWQGLYAIPLNRWGTLFDVHGRVAKSRIIESPFDVLDIESSFEEVGFALSHPIYRSLRTDISLGAIWEWRRGRNTVDGYDFNFSEASVDGETVVTVLRLYQELIHRDEGQIFALRSRINLGIPVLDATRHAGKREDSDFVSWLIQTQYARRFDPWGIEAVLRADAQIAFDRLPPLEQFSVGGRYSVRGYRENRLVRDNGVTTSLEVRVPVWRRPDGRWILQVAPFIDYGYSWNTDRVATIGPQNLLGIGIGGRWRVTERLYSEVYFAGSIFDVPTPDPEDLQDSGIYFRVTAELF